MYNGFLSYQIIPCVIDYDYSQDPNYWCFLCLLHGPVEDALPSPAQLLTLLEALFTWSSKYSLSIHWCSLPHVLQTRCNVKRSQLTLEGVVWSIRLQKNKKKSLGCIKRRWSHFFPSTCVDQRENTIRLRHPWFPDVLRNILWFQ